MSQSQPHVLFHTTLRLQLRLLRESCLLRGLQLVIGLARGSPSSSQIAHGIIELLRQIVQRTVTCQAILAAALDRDVDVPRVPIGGVRRSDATGCAATLTPRFVLRRGKSREFLGKRDHALLRRTEHSLTHNVVLIVLNPFSLLVVTLVNAASIGCQIERTAVTVVAKVIVIVCSGRVASC